MNYPQRILEFALDTIFPIRCIQCGIFSSLKRSGYLCKKCLLSIPIKKQFECIGCKTSATLGKTCFQCKNNNFFLDQLLIVSDYKNPSIIKIIKAFKYRFIIEMIQPLSLLIKKYIFWLNNQKKFNIIGENPIIIPLPLHYRRLNWRGFNQAEIIAKSLADILQIDLETNLLERAGSRPQAEIEIKEERIINAKEIYKKTQNLQKVKNRVVILVDDICTTGTSLNECARILKEAGARKTIGFVIARG